MTEAASKQTLPLEEEAGRKDNMDVTEFPEKAEAGEGMLTDNSHFPQGGTRNELKGVPDFWGMQIPHAISSDCGFATKDHRTDSHRSGRPKVFLEGIEVAMIPAPTQPPLPPDPNRIKEKTEKMMNKLLEKATAEFFDRHKQLKDNMVAIYSIAWSQCSEGVRAEIRENATSLVNSDPGWILKQIRSMVHDFENQNQVHESNDQAWVNFYSFCQHKTMPTVRYLTEFKTKVYLAEHFTENKKAFGNDPTAVKVVLLEQGLEIGKATQEQLENDGANSHKCALAMAFIKCSCRKHFGLLKKELKNIFTRGMHQYPEELSTAYNLLSEYKAPTCGGGSGGGCPTNQLIDFAQTGTLVPGMDV